MPRLLIPRIPPDDLPVSALRAVESMIKAGRRSFGSPAASLTWGIDGAVEGDVTAGKEGEKMTAKILDAWVKKYTTAVVFHSVLWPGVDGDSDHIVVIGRHMIIIDSKRWKSKRKYSVTASGTIKRGTVAFPEGNVKMIVAMNAWRKVMGKGTRVSGVVNIAQEEVFVPYDKNWQSAPFKLVTADKLEEYLDRFMLKDVKEDNRDMIDLNVLLPIATRLVKPRNRRAEVINIDAIKKMKR